MTSARSGRPPVKYDPDQLAVIECQDKLVVAEAKAGSGKTTTAIGVAQHRPNERFLYLVFGKSNQLEAERRFGPNVTCRTTHSMAFSDIGRHYADRVSTSWSAKLLATEMGEGRGRVAAVARATLLEFLRRPDASISEKHLEAVAAEWMLAGPEGGHALDLARRAWSAMTDVNSRVSMPHDAYLKMWVLRKPVLPYPNLLIDEAQDLNALTAQVLLEQQRSRMVLLGDRHQGIMAFRGAVNAMKVAAEMGGTVLHMPRTWRFGARTAAIANEVLFRLKGEKVAIIGMGQDSPMPKNAPMAVLSRTNSVLFGIAASRRGAGVHWVGGIENYRISRVLDAYHLFIRAHHLIQDPMLRRYPSWTEFVEETESTKDADSRILIKIVGSFGAEIPDLLADMRRSAVRESKDADLVLTSGHRCKGFEWSFVRISEDYECLFAAETELAQDGVLSEKTEQEVNLLYVGITRAQKFAILNAETKEWLAHHQVVLPGDPPQIIRPLQELAK